MAVSGLQLSQCGELSQVVWDASIMSEKGVILIESMWNSASGYDHSSLASGPSTKSPPMAVLRMI